MIKRILILLLVVAGTAFGGRRGTIGFEMSHNNGNPISTWGTNDPNQSVNSGDGSYNSHGTGRTGVAVNFYSAVTIPDASYKPFTQFSGWGMTTAVYGRLWLKVAISPAPANNIRIFRFVDGTGVGMEVWWTTANKIALGMNGSIKATCSSTIPNNSWELIQLYTTGETSGNFNRLQYRGETLTDNTNYANTTINGIQVGFIDFNNATLGNGCSFMVDDIAVNDTLGTYEIGAPDDSGQVIYMKPVSDNAIGNWLAGAGGNTNLWTALDSVPPCQCSGTIACENNTTNIYNVTSSATDNYDANIMDYTTAGVPSAKTIRLVQSLARGAEHTATGTKSGAVKLFSNPADTGETTFTFGLDVGAHVEDLSDTTGPNWPANTWATALGAVVYFPSVNRGTQPVVRVGRRTADVNQICVDQLGILVEYGSSAGAPVSTRGFIINGD